MTVDLPSKLYFKIGEVAKYAEVAPHVIRYWESEFDNIRPKRANSRQRLFRKEDVLLILQIKELLHKQGFTIAGAKKHLSRQTTSPDDLVPQEITVEKTAASKKSETLVHIKKELLAIRELLQDDR
jgi:DNA-binding transcriptional MerR regulator